MSKESEDIANDLEEAMFGNIKPHGNRCYGHRFAIETDQGEVVVRRCSFDGTICPADEASCTACEREVKDSEIAVHAEQATAAIVWLETLGIWCLVQLPDGANVIMKG